MEVISRYTRAQAIADDVLVDLRTGDRAEAHDLEEVVRNAGIRLPLACTMEVWLECIALTPMAKEMGNDIKGRLWDVCWMFVNAARKAKGKSTLVYELMVVRDEQEPTLTKLKMVCGPGDNAEPVLTLMFPGQD